MSNVLEVQARAKVNLSLDVLRRRENGYHDLRMIMQTVDLFDTIRMECTEAEGIELTSNVTGLPCDKSNLIYKAAALMQDTFQLPGGIRIHLTKRIPMAAGMAGGSTDAAAVFNGMNELYEIGATKERLCELGVTIGADVPYCIIGGTALAEGIGEILTILPNVPDCPLLIAKPNFDVSTKYVYENLHANELKVHPDIDGMVQAIHNHDLDGILSRMGNVLETVTESKYPEITEIKTFMKNHGALNAMMSGSGPTVFGLFESREEAEQAAKSLEQTGLTNQIYVSAFAHR